MKASDLSRLIGKEIGLSGWRVIDQARINRFADVTEDHQFIHVDPERAAAAGFGGTIAHGFLTLSLLSVLAREALPTIEGATTGLNYGFDRVRFLAPVPAGGRVRARFSLKAAEARGPEALLMRCAVDVEIENQPKPAIAAEWLTMFRFD